MCHLVISWGMTWGVCIPSIMNLSCTEKEILIYNYFIQWNLQTKRIGINENFLHKRCSSIWAESNRIYFIFLGAIISWLWIFKVGRWTSTKTEKSFLLPTPWLCCTRRAGAREDAVEEGNRVGSFTVVWITLAWSRLMDGSSDCGRTSRGRVSST
jgi:hypothetical protein